MIKMTSKTHVQISNEESQSHRSRVLQDILAKSQFLDVTIVNEEREWGAHKLILSSASPVLRRILDRGPAIQSLLCLIGTKSSTIEALLNFIYEGEASVKMTDVQTFMRLGNDLQLEGIYNDVNDEILSNMQQHRTNKNCSKVNKNDLFFQRTTSVSQRIKKETLHEHENYQIESELNPHDSEEMDSNVTRQDLKKSFEKNSSMSSDNALQFEVLTESKHDVDMNKVRTYKKDNDLSRKSSIPIDSTLPVTSISEFCEAISPFMVKFGSKQWKCSACPYSSDFRQHVMDHAETHLGPLLFVCTFCEKEFARHHFLRRHVKKQHREFQDKSEFKNDYSGRKILKESNGK